MKRLSGRLQWITGRAQHMPHAANPSMLPVEQVLRHSAGHGLGGPVSAVGVAAGRVQWRRDQAPRESTLPTSLFPLACVGGALLLLAAPVVRQDAPAAPAVPALSSLDLPLAQLKDGRQEFTYRMATSGPSGPPELLGSVILSTRIKGGKFTFTDWAGLQFSGTPCWIEMTTAGSVGNELRPEHLSVRGTMAILDSRALEFSAVFTATSATVTFGDKTFDVAVPGGTITVDVLYRLVTLLPRSAGFVASYEHYLDANEMHVKPGGTITCASATENVDVGGKTVKAFRFDVTSGDHVFMSLWVDDTGRLVQSCLDGTKWLVAKT